MTTKVKDIGTPLINTQHEAFAQFIFQGYNNTQAAKLAKYSPKTAKVQGSRLLTYVDIVDRISQLYNSMAKSTIGTAEERREILTEIYRNKREQSKAKTSAIEVHNKMDRLYTPESKGDTTVNNTWNVVVIDAEAEDLVKRLMSGERTG